MRSSAARQACLSTSRSFRLGGPVNSIRSHGIYVETTMKSRQEQYDTNRARLDQIGFVWDSNQYVFDTQLMPALKYFGQTQGHKDVPRRYVLNEEQCRAAGLPGHIKEFRIGETFNSICSVGNYVEGKIKSRQEQYDTNRARLAQIGFVWARASTRRVLCGPHRGPRAGASGGS
jgi:hypothetical protein